MFKLRATPTIYIGSDITYAAQYFEGSDGKLYDDGDLAWLTAEYGEPKSRKTKYGTSYYFKKGE